MATNTVSARLAETTSSKLEFLAQTTKRSKSYLVGEAVQEYIKVQKWQIAAMKKGLEPAEQGDFASEDEVRDFFKSWGIYED